MAAPSNPWKEWTPLFERIVEKIELSRNRRTRAIAAILLAGLNFAIGLLLREPFAGASYDLLHGLAGGTPPKDLAATIVYLDRSSYQMMGRDPLRRWPRELHAELLRRLAKAGARAVVFDIIFDSAGEERSGDEKFAAAIRENGRVILAAEQNEKTTHRTGEGLEWTRATSFRPPYEPFLKAGADWGVASLAIDDDLEARRFLAGFPESGKPSLAWATGQRLRLAGADLGMASANGHWIRYYGPALTIPHVSFSEALDPGSVPDEYFRDRIVFVGARPMEGRMNERRDEFRSPFHSWGNKEYFMPGVEVHATELLNLARGDWLKRLSNASETGILAGIALLFGGGLLWLRPAPAGGAAVVGAALALGVSGFAFTRGFWFPWLASSAGQIPAALGGSILFHSAGWYRARRRYEARIREQAALIDKAHDAILVQSLPGRTIYANASAQRLLGWTLSELEGLGGEFLSADAERAAEARTQALRSGEWTGELRMRTRSGGVVVTASRWTLIRDDRGGPRELLLINTDITEQKNLEQQFLRTQRMNTIGTLAGGMAHDLNNALAPILMGTQLLRRRTSDPDSRELLSTMEASTHRGAEMVRQVLLFARGRGGEFERLNLASLIRELEKIVRDTFPKNVAVEAFLPDDLWSVWGNSTQMHQVLLNLSVNARDAMPSGGKLTFVADNVRLTEREAALMPEGKPGEFVSILVSDTGAGMPPAVRDRIFEPFFSTKGEGQGTGIGLSTVARIVKSHEGLLRVESAEGEGTSFEILLPRAEEAQAKEKVEAAPESRRGHGELILVLDDEKAIRQLVCSELGAAGYNVLAAETAAQAAVLLRRHGRQIRALISDSSMPQDLPDGIVPILTSGGLAEEQPGVLVLKKPFTLAELLSVVQRGLCGRGGASLE